MSNEPHTWPRLYLDAPLGAGGRVALSHDQTHYLLHVLRAQEGEPLRLFNGRDGEWLARLEGVPQRKKDVAVLLVEAQRLPQEPEPDLWLCCAPIKKARFETIIEKATELGVSVIQPILTARTQWREMSLPRLQSIAIEAAEQSERLTVPEVRAPIALKECLAHWPQKRLAIICAEHGAAQTVQDGLGGALARARAAAGVFTGPEGGFTGEEIALMAALPEALPVRLGRRILRADTAALAALSCWQALCGDWRDSSDPRGRG